VFEDKRYDWEEIKLRPEVARCEICEINFNKERHISLKSNIVASADSICNDCTDFLVRYKDRSEIVLKNASNFFNELHRPKVNSKIPQFKCGLCEKKCKTVHQVNGTKICGNCKRWWSKRQSYTKKVYSRNSKLRTKNCIKLKWISENETYKSVSKLAQCMLCLRNALNEIQGKRLCSRCLNWVTRNDGKVYYKNKIRKPTYEKIEIALKKKIFENTTWTAPIIADQIQSSEYETTKDNKRPENPKISDIVSPTLQSVNDEPTERNLSAMVHRLPVWPSTSFKDFEMTLDMKQECIDACNRQNIVKPNHDTSDIECVVISDTDSDQSPPTPIESDAKVVENLCSLCDGLAIHQKHRFYFCESCNQFLTKFCLSKFNFVTSRNDLKKLEKAKKLNLFAVGYTPWVEPRIKIKDEN